MSGRQGGGGGGRNKVLLPPINFIFKLLQQRTTVQIWLFEQLGMRIEGKIRGFDEFMNLVVDEAVEVRQSTKTEPSPRDAEDGGRRELGRFLSFFLLRFWGVFFGGVGVLGILREIGIVDMMRSLLLTFIVCRPDFAQGR